MSEVETNLGNEKYYDPYKKTSSDDLKKSDQHHKKSESTNIILTEHNKGNEDDEKHSRKRAMTTPYGKDSNLDNEDLPSGWEQRQTPEGLYYYVDHNTKTTQWHHPNYDHHHHHHHTKSRSSTDAPKSSTSNINPDNNNNNDNNDNKEKKAKKRRNSISSGVIEDEYIRILRTPPKRVKIGYTTILFSSHPSLTLQVAPTAQLACDWLNSLRNYNFKIEHLSLNLNKSLMKGLNLWMNIFKDNHQTKHTYDKYRKWQYKIFGLSSIAATLDPHIEGNSKTTKIMNDFMIWRTSLSSDIPIIYTLSHSRTYACILVIYQSLSAREIPDNTNTILSDKTDITHPEKEGDLSYHRHHHRHHHKSKDDKEKSKEEKDKSKDEKSKEDKSKVDKDIKEKDDKDLKEKLKEEKDIKEDKEKDEKEKLKDKDLKESDDKDIYEKNLPENKKEEKEELEKDEKKNESRGDSKNKSSLSDNNSNQNIEKKDEKKLHSKWIP